MDTRVFDYFVAISEQGSYAKAAKELYVTPQAISGAVKRLEESLGVPLVAGRGDGLRLTSYGETVARYAVDINSSLDSLAMEIQSMKKAHSRELSFAAAIGLLDCFPTGFIEAFNAQHESSVNFIESLDDYSCKERLLAGIYDYALLQRPINDSDIRDLPLYSDFAFVWVQDSDPLAERDFLISEDLKGRLVVAVEGGSGAGVTYASSSYRGVISEHATLVFVDEMIEVLRRVVAGGCVGVTWRSRAEGIPVKGVRGIPIRDLRLGISLCCRADRNRLAIDEEFEEYMQGFERFYD